MTLSNWGANFDPTVMISVGDILKRPYDGVLRKISAVWTGPDVSKRWGRGHPPLLAIYSYDSRYLQYTHEQLAATVPSGDYWFGNHLEGGDGPDSVCYITNKVDPRVPPVVWDESLPPYVPPRIKYGNLVLACPKDADKTILQLAPTPTMTVTIPGPTKRLMTVYANGTRRAEMTIPPLVWTTALMVDGRDQPVRMDAHIFQHDRSQPGMLTKAYMPANAYTDGRICWGENEFPKSLRAAHNTFFGAPFNPDLWDTWHDHEDDCEHINGGRHECEEYIRGSSCERDHECNHGEGNPHEHECENAQKRYDKNNDIVLDLSGKAYRCDPDETRGYRHIFQAYAWTLGDNSQRLYIRQRNLHLDTPERLKKFSRTLKEHFGTDEKCPCKCCTKMCQCRTGCECCDNTCGCMYCRCYEGSCGCVTDCDCCDGNCRCIGERGKCQHDMSSEFVKHLESYHEKGDRRLTWKDRKASLYGKSYIEFDGATETVIISDSPDTLKLVPAKYHSKDGEGITVVVGVGKRQSNGSYLVTYGGGEDKFTATIERKDLTLCV